MVADEEDVWHSEKGKAEEGEEAVVSVSGTAWKSASSLAEWCEGHKTPDAL